MGVIHIDLPENLLLSTGQTQEELIKEAKFFVALKLFESGRISSGRAAEICGLARVEFLLLAGRSGVPVADLDADELDREFMGTTGRSTSPS
jgi:predicted HTH domain antitoxin